MYGWFQKDKPFFIRCNTSSSFVRRSQTEQTQESKRENKQPIGKQHVDNQSEEDTSHRDGKREKEEETEKKSNQNINKCYKTKNNVIK